MAINLVANLIVALPLLAILLPFASAQIPVPGPANPAGVGVGIAGVAEAPSGIAPGAVASAPEDDPDPVATVANSIAANTAGASAATGAVAAGPHAAPGNAEAGPSFFNRPLLPDYYKQSCPNAEKIIFDVINQNKDEKSTLPGITRLLFHDCFITGCDASIMLETSPSDQAEIAYPANSVSIRGLDVIAHAKAEVEKVCPGIVSCADILAYAARDCAVISGNPSYPVVGGRRDSLVSRVEDAKELPGPDWSMDKIVAAFAERNVSLEGVVALLGAHSIGVSRCYNTIANKVRMARVPGGEQALEPGAKKFIEDHCPDVTEGKVPLNLVDETGPWGVSYFNNTLHGRVVIPSDLGLLMDPEAKKVTEKFAADPKLWAEKYNEAMMNMGTWNTLTNLHVGEIRTKCGFRNGQEPPKPNGDAQQPQKV